MSVRVGLGVPTSEVDLGEYVDRAEALGFDSLWVTERVSSAIHDPIVAMTWAAARTTRMKIGTSVMVLPGRRPALLAKALASLDVLSRGRILPAFGLGLPAKQEHQAFGVNPKDRAAIFEEALPLMRRLWAEESVDHDGEWFQLSDARVEPKPTHGGFDVWLGGVTPRELDRCGRLGDGWIGAFTAPSTVEASIAQINSAADRVGRAIDDDHFGVFVAYHPGPDLPRSLTAAVARTEPGLDVTDVVATSPETLEKLLQRYVEAGASKFIVGPQVAAADWSAELATLADVARAVEQAA